MSGDGYTSDLASASLSETRDRGSSVENAISEEEMGQVAAALHAVHGTPKRVAPDKFKAHEAKVFALFGAKTNAAKEAVRNAMVYVAIVNGTGTNVDTTEIPVTPTGLSTHMANEYVADIIDQRYYRRFMAWYTQRAIKMVKSSPEVRYALAERCIRDGIPTTEIVSTVDFLDTTSGMTDRAIAARIRGKYAAVARANNNGRTGQHREAIVAAETMHHYHDDDAADP